MPSTAFHDLARAIGAAGGELCCDNDFDWPGIAITGALLGRYTARPWRMSEADHRSGPGDGDDHARLDGKAARPTPWDPGLSRAMAGEEAIVYEEAVADHLLGDLS